MRRRTLARSFARAGRGVHSGRWAVVSVQPAGWGTGLVVERSGLRACVGLHTVRAVPGMTTMRAGALHVDLLEHLLAALVAGGVTDARVVVNGGQECPILDGSAREWWRALETVDGPPIVPLQVRRTVEVVAFGGRARLEPCDRRVVEVVSDFGVGWRGRRRVDLDADDLDEVLGARTFAAARDVVRLRSLGRGSGADASNTLVLGGPLQGALRVPDEPVAHKLLDAVGDLAWLGRPLLGRFVVERGSHRLHVAALRALAA